MLWCSGLVTIDESEMGGDGCVGNERLIQLIEVIAVGSRASEEMN